MTQKRKCEDCMFCTLEDDTEWTPRPLRPVNVVIIQRHFCRYMPKVLRVTPDGWCFQFKEKESA